MSVSSFCPLVKVVGVDFLLLLNSVNTSASSQVHWIHIHWKWIFQGLLHSRKLRIKFCKNGIAVQNIILGQTWSICIHCIHEFKPYMTLWFRRSNGRLKWPERRWWNLLRPSLMISIRVPWLSMIVMIHEILNHYVRLRTALSTDHCSTTTRHDLEMSWRILVIFQSLHSTFICPIKSHSTVRYCQKMICPRSASWSSKRW